MRLAVPADDAALAVDHGDNIVGRHRTIPLDLQIDRAGQKQAVVTDDASDPLAREDGIAPRSGRRIISLRIAFAQIVGEHTFGPQHQSWIGLRVGSGAERGQRQETRFVLARIVECFLIEIGLHERVVDRALAARTHGPVHSCEQEDAHQRDAHPFAPQGEIGQRNRQQDGEARKRVGASKRQECGETRPIERTQQRQTERAPGVAGEQRRAQVLRDDPASPQRQRVYQRAASARETIGQHERERGIEREVHRQQRHGGPPYRGGHLVLMGERRRDPQVGDDEMRQPEQPAAEQGAAHRSGEPDQDCRATQRDDRERPQVDRGKAERGQRAERHEGHSRMGESPAKRAIQQGPPPPRQAPSGGPQGVCRMSATRDRARAFA